MTLADETKAINFGKSKQRSLDRVKNRISYSIYSLAVQGLVDDVCEVADKQQLARAFRVNERNPTNGRSLLHEAAANGHLELAQILISHYGANVNCRTYLGKETPLHLAVNASLRSMVFMLLNYGADPNIQSKYLSTPLHYCKKRSIAALLCRSGAKCTMRNINHQSPVQVIIEEMTGDAEGDELITFLLELNKEGTKEDFRKEIEANRLQKENDATERAAMLVKRGAGGKKAF
jgi:ankyrin repeat protein